MKKVFAVVTAALLGCAGAASDSLASAFRLPDQDSAAMGTAGAFAGQADNPSAAWYNPAGMTRLDGTSVSAGVIGIYPVMRHETPQGTVDVSDRKVFLPATFYSVNKMNESLSWGISVNSPFGLSTDWAVGASTSRVATLSRISSMNVNPNIAYKMNDRLSIAAGIDYLKVVARLEKSLGPGELFQLDGEGAGWGANAAALFKDGERLNIGFCYRSRMKVKIDDANANVVGAPLSFSNPARTEITLPDLVQLGSSYKVTDRLTTMADLEYTWWSTYDRVEMQSNTFLAMTGGATDRIVDEKQWHNTWTVRVGAQYGLSDQWKLRAGYVYDQNPVPDAHFDTRNPDAARQGIAIGAGYTSGRVTIDSAYLYMVFKTRHITDSVADGTTQVLNGTYKSEAHLFGLTVAYKF